jgi:hypothetical protein
LTGILPLRREDEDGKRIEDWDILIAGDVADFVDVAVELLYIPYSI